MPINVQGNSSWASYSGTKEFLASLESLAGLQHGAGEPSPDFNWQAPVYVARAPGRMDVMGGIADYSGSLVLQMPIAEACFAALQLQQTGAALPAVRVVSMGGDGHRSALYTSSLSDLFPGGEPLAYASAVSLFKKDPSTSWAAYVVGCLLVLAREKGVDLSSRGVNILIRSQVPEGKGVSSSAAVEVAVMVALVGAMGLKSLSGWELAVLCQKVENLVVGAPCGIMDQMACALGEEGRLLELLCQPAEVQGTVAIPTHLRVWGIDSGVRHSVGGSDYGSVRVGAYMGLKLARKAWKDKGGGEGVPEHLVHVAPGEYEAWLKQALPESIKGCEFLDTYGLHLDTVTKVNPEQEYAVMAPSAHPIAEHHRVRVFRQLLIAPPSTEQCMLLGEIMFQSHESYNTCRLGSTGTDRLVQMVRDHIQAAGTAPLLYGAKITGGGSGGTVCILGAASEAADEAVQRIADTYWTESGQAGQPHVFRGSSGGAISLGALEVIVTSS